MAKKKEKYKDKRNVMLDTLLNAAEKSLQAATKELFKHHEENINAGLNSDPYIAWQQNVVYVQWIFEQSRKEALENFYEAAKEKAKKAAAEALEELAREFIV